LSAATTKAILRDIFKRINSAGKSLDDADVFDALNGSRSQSRPSTIPRSRPSWKSWASGTSKREFCTGCCAFCSGCRSWKARAASRHAWLTQEAAEAYRKTAATASQIILFLKNDAGIPHYELLPYKQAFVTLGRFFQLHPQPSPRSCQLLARWIWRGALNGAHQGDTVSTRKVLARILPGERGTIGGRHAGDGQG
jgi:hypothetical protein